MATGAGAATVMRDEADAPAGQRAAVLQNARTSRTLIVRVVRECEFDQLDCPQGERRQVGVVAGDDSVSRVDVEFGNGDRHHAMGRGLAEHLRARREAEQVRGGDRVEDCLPGIGLDGVHPVAEAMFGELRFHQLPRRYAGAGSHAAKRREIADRRTLQFRQGVALAYDHDQVADKQFAEDQIRHSLEQAAHREVQIARLHEPEELRVEAHMKLNLGSGTFREEAREERLADQSNQHVSHANPDLADLSGPQLLHLPFGIVERDPGPVDAGAKRRPDRRQLDAARRTYE